MLVHPDIRYQASVVAADAEFGDEWADGSGQYLGPRVGLEDPQRFAAWVAMLLSDAEEHPGGAGPGGGERVPSTLLWIVDGDEFIGFVAIRHRLSDWLLQRGGHIGYSVRPSARRRGWATRALAEALPIAYGMGIDPVLVCADETNIGSRAVIEANGGAYEDTREGTRRYWIAAPASAAR